jgi:hypothetical protein
LINRKEPQFVISAPGFGFGSPTLLFVGNEIKKRLKWKKGEKNKISHLQPDGRAQI